MSDKLYPKGSVWRKWDLQVHTPKSILNNEFGDDFDEYVKKVFKKAIEKNIYAIGFTDYFSIEGYKKIRQDYLDNHEKMLELFSQDEINKIQNILILPNIEFRLNKLVVSNRINFHVILSNNVSINDIEENFLKEIDFVYEGNPQDFDEKRKLTINNLTEFGRKLKSEHVEFQSDNDLFVGMKCAVVDDTQILKILNEKKSIFNKKYLVGIPADEDLSSINWNGQDHNVRKVIIQKSDFIFSSNGNTRSWGLGEKHATLGSYIDEFKSLKPCIWGSDCHNFNKLFSPDLNRFSWIKANTTFEGLRQIIYEPNHRVRIQELEPEIKEKYHVIDRVRFIDTSDKKLFSQDWIELNPFLNSIIGGKSSGKSILLYYIAKTLDSKRIDEINYKYDEKSRKYFYSFEEDGNFDFEVQWADNETYKLSENNVTRKITYIPQLYLNDLAEDRKHELNEVVDKILSENIAYKDTKDSLNDEISTTIRELNTAIDVYFENYKKLLLLEKELNELDDKKAVEESIKLKEEQIERLKDESDFDENEMKKYSNLTIKRNMLIDGLSKLEDYLTSYNRLSITINDMKNSKIPVLITDQFKGLIYDDNSFEKVLNIFKIRTIAESSNLFIKELEQIDAHIKHLEKRKSQYSIKLEDFEKELIPYEGKIERQSEYKSVLDALDKEKTDLKLIRDKENEIKSQKGKIKDEIIEIKYKQLFDLYTSWQQLTVAYKNISPKTKLTLVGKVNFDHNSFDLKFSNMISKKSPLKNQFGEMFGEDNTYLFEQDSHIKSISSIVKSIIFDKNFKINKGYRKIDVVKALFDNYFSIDFDLKQGNDLLLDMSPGKRGIILFQLYLHLSNSNTPILIDQPEDSLDNRTVYQELNNFIKDKKVKRQIIIISHNPNLVVSTDSENIIVANQKGQNKDSKNENYQFEYVSGAIENTFQIDSEYILQKMGIRDHICHILEGGRQAFEKREKKYGF